MVKSFSFRVSSIYKLVITSIIPYSLVEVLQRIKELNPVRQDDKFKGRLNVIVIEDFGPLFNVMCGD